MVYFQNVKDDYIKALQTQLCEKENVNKLFETIQNDGAKYELVKEDSHQTYGLVTTVKYGKCIFNSDQMILYRPIEYLDILISCFMLNI